MPLVLATSISAGAMSSAQATVLAALPGQVSSAATAAGSAQSTANSAATAASAAQTSATSASTAATSASTALATHAALTSTAHGGIVSSTDARLTDARTPSDGSVTNAKVAANAAIAWSKVDKTGAVAGDVGAYTTAQVDAITSPLQDAAAIAFLVTGDRAMQGPIVMDGNNILARSILSQGGDPEIELATDATNFKHDGTPIASIKGDGLSIAPGKSLYVGNGTTRLTQNDSGDYLRMEAPETYCYLYIRGYAINESDAVVGLALVDDLRGNASFLEQIGQGLSLAVAGADFGLSHPMRLNKDGSVDFNLDGNNKRSTFNGFIAAPNTPTYSTNEDAVADLGAGVAWQDLDAIVHITY